MNKAMEKDEFLTPPKDQIKTIEVENCQGCHFTWLDSGLWGCDIADIEGYFREMPEDKVHDKCPLKNMNYRIRLK